MRASILIGCLIFGLLAHEAQAYEWGIGGGRIQGCLARGGDAEELCSKGPALSLSLGLNLWGKDYRAAKHDTRAFADTSFTDFDAHGAGRFHLNLKDWDEVVTVIVISLLLSSVIYAVMYPFSSRLDIGVIGRSGWQEQVRADLQLWRNEAGVYLRAYLSQHFPMYIYGSGMFSYQNVRLGTVMEKHQVLVKGLGLGFMSPTQGGLYFHGVWESSTLIDPGPKELLNDADDVKLFRNSVAEILDGSYFELGYIWYR